MRRVGATWVREETKSGSPEFQVQRSGLREGGPRVWCPRCGALRGPGCSCSEGEGGEGRGTNFSQQGAPRTAPIRVGGGSVRAWICLKKGGAAGEKEKKKK